MCVCGGGLWRGVCVCVGDVLCVCGGGDCWGGGEGGDVCVLGGVFVYLGGL